MKNLLVCVTGAVSSVVMPSYIAQMRKIWDCDIQVVMSKNATRFVTPYALQLHSGKTVFTESFQIDDSVLVPHIKFTQEADALLVMPATASIISKVAHGFCDDLVSTSILACKKPVIFIPSMNENMWNDPILQKNVSTLLKYGYNFIEPRSGSEIQGLAKTYGVMPMFNDVVKAIEEILFTAKV